MLEQRCPECGRIVPEGSSFCPSCGQPLLDQTDAPTRTALEESGVPAARKPLPRSSSAGAGRFVPGEVLDRRYRIIGLLGRGGMGEVYRADDLKLGEPVALKFLPESLGDDPDRLKRFFNEARTARQVTHPNVCRVFDLGEIERQHFISMEYVDGEDLATLLRRIGHLPAAKAVQIARQLCAGIAAAHQEGILHRDLKPANIMLDGRGRVRITDFGLAGLADEMRADDARAGTPAYQAPEQLAGEEVSTASDIYALGLVLYEVFTGKRAFEATSRAELQRKQLETTPPSLSSHVGGLDETIDRVVRRCLSPDPKDRPGSALEVSAALPGGDPLAAALAAGETPSPEMVANAGEVGGLKLWVALSLLGVVLVGLAADYAFRTRHSVLGRLGLPRAPAELRYEARRLLHEIGHEAPANDVVWSFFSDLDFYAWIEEHRADTDPWDDLEQFSIGPLQFWYRQTPGWFEATGFEPRVTRDEPPSTEPGTADLRLDREGRLLELRVLPPIVRRAGNVEPPDWSPLLAATGIDMDGLVEAEPRANPPLNCASQQAWEGAYPEADGSPVRIEACAVDGRPAYLEVMPPWSRRFQALAGDDPALFWLVRAERIGDPVMILLGLVIIAGAGFLARRNFRLGRVDRQGTARFAWVVFGLGLAEVLIRANHAGRAQDEMRLLMSCLASATFGCAAAWLLYAGVEPFVRRVWPQTVIAWRRLLDGRLADPLVGRDILIGAAAGQLVILGRMVRPLLGEGEPAASGPLGFVSGVKLWAAQTLSVSDAVLGSIVFTAFVVLLRILLRRDWLTWVVPTAFMVVMAVVVTGKPIPGIAMALIWGSFYFVVIRFGLLAILSWALVARTDQMVQVWDPSSWFFPYVVAGLLVVLAPVLYGFFVSLRGTTLIRDELLDG